MSDRMRTAILDAAARVLGQRPDAAMADIADEADVGRATLYRYFPTRESLLRGVADSGAAELAEGIEAANLDELAADRAIARLTAVFVRTGAKYAAVMSQLDAYHDPAEKERVIKPVREVMARGIEDGVLRGDLPGDALFEMFTALIERAMWLAIDGVLTPEAATEAVVATFLDGVRLPL
ncbi:TetR/AcrR family transcriptional regulator [Mycobacterium sp. pUA109]|uniref:TetR/AcrR family transcriptional regulator n=1 Tax=Mycobacterium sp. pUA109 TaxID=3238982 RepID=UPI00351B84AA